MISRFLIFLTTVLIFLLFTFKVLAMFSQFSELSEPSEVFRSQFLCFLEDQNIASPIQLCHWSWRNDGGIVEFWLYFIIILFKSRGYGSQLASKTASEASAFCKLQKIIFGRKWHFWYLKVCFCSESLYKRHSAQFVELNTSFFP